MFERLSKAELSKEEFTESLQLGAARLIQMLLSGFTFARIRHSPQMRSEECKDQYGLFFSVIATVHDQHDGRSY